MSRWTPALALALLTALQIAAMAVPGLPWWATGAIVVACVGGMAFLSPKVLAADPAGRSDADRGGLSRRKRSALLWIVLGVTLDLGAATVAGPESPWRLLGNAMWIGGFGWLGVGSLLDLQDAADATWRSGTSEAEESRSED